VTREKHRWSLRDWKVPLLRKMDGEGWEALPIQIRPRKKAARPPLWAAAWAAPLCGLLTLIGLVLWSLMGGA
jgi:hypothetical protein